MSRAVFLQIAERKLGWSLINQTKAIRCPVPGHGKGRGDHAPSLSIGVGQDGSAFVHCHAGCPAEEVVAACGAAMADLYPPKHARNGKKALPQRYERRTDFAIRNEAGEVVAIHRRVDRANGGKDCYWHHPDGRPSKNGEIKPADLPLYGIHELPTAPADAAIVIVEGEKARDALEQYLDALVLATVTGCGGTPGERAFASLTGRDFVLWPDNDEKGRKHMDRVARRAKAAGAASVRVVSWSEAPPSGDGADFVAQNPSKERVQELLDAAVPWRPASVAATQADDDAPDAAPGKTEDPPGSVGTELWFARLLVSTHGRDLRYIGAWKKWLVWDATEGRWKANDSGEVMRRAKQVLRETLPGELKRTNVKDPETIISRFHKLIPLRNAITLASSEKMVIASATDFDADPWVLNVANGTIELRTLEIRPHRREDLLTKRCPVAYDPHANADTWTRFLERILPDAKVRDYMQRASGYSLTGDVGEHVVHVLHGNGRNGKTTFTEAMAYVLGDYAGPVPLSLLMRSRSEQHPTERATLFKRRFVVAAEAPEGGRLNESQVKALTGGDRISVRRMKEDFWDFAPTHKLFVCTNHRPRITGTDEGIWRRLRLIPFDVVIPEDECDPELPTTLRAEAAGILRWALEGLRKYEADGLSPPEAVRVATAEYRTDEDTLADFISASIRREPGFVSSQAIYNEYLAWANATGVRNPMARRTLTARLRAEGFEYTNTPDRGFRGITLAETNATDTAWEESP